MALKKWAIRGLFGVAALGVGCFWASDDGIVVDAMGGNAIMPKQWQVSLAMAMGIEGYHAAHMSVVAMAERGGDYTVGDWSEVADYIDKVAYDIKLNKLETFDSEEQEQRWLWHAREHILMGSLARAAVTKDAYGGRSFPFGAYDHDYHDMKAVTTLLFVANSYEHYQGGHETDAFDIGNVYSHALSWALFSNNHDAIDAIVRYSDRVKGALDLVAEIKRYASLDDYSFMDENGLNCTKFMWMSNLEKAAQTTNWMHSDKPNSYQIAREQLSSEGNIKAVEYMDHATKLGCAKDFEGSRGRLKQRSPR